jgi:polysaccharide biosynthesis PFTS motif protein
MIIRQYLLIRVGGYNLNKALLASLGGGGAVVHPLPARWRQIVRGHGFAVAEFRCTVWWHAYIAFLGTYGLWLFWVRGLSALLASLQRALPKMGRYAYFESLSPGNLPQPATDGRSHDILSWYLQWPGHIADIKTLAHNVIGVPAGMVQGTGVCPLKNPFPLPAGGHCLRDYFMWGMVAGGCALVDFLRGRWWHAMLLSEAVKAAQIRLAEPDLLACDYLFHNSGWIYRPLWSYEAEAKGSRIIFYFYSTNTESFKTPQGYPIQANSWQAMNWPLYLVWDEGQADFVCRAKGKEAPVQVVGPIWFHASSTEIPALPPQTIAVFDIQPMRAAFYSTLGAPLDFYTPETATRFLGDILAGARSCGAMLVFKRKRKIGRLAHPAYRKFVENLDVSPDYVAIDPDISAQLVIEKSAVVISMPFTSTALIARELGKPTCYYDPTGLVQKDDRAAHGIEIISGRVELARWLGSVLGSARHTENTGGLEAAMKDGQKAAGLVG